MRIVSAILLSIALLMSGAALADNLSDVSFSFTLPEGWTAAESGEEFFCGDASRLNVQVSDGTGMTMELIAESGDAYRAMFEDYGAEGIEICGVQQYGENVFFVMGYQLSGASFRQALTLIDGNLFTLTFTDLADDGAFDLILSSFAA